MERKTVGGLTRRVVLTVIVAFLFASCSGSDASDGRSAATDVDENGPVEASETPDVPAPEFVLDVRAALDAVESELGGAQEFFEVTSNAQFTNVFVAVDDGSAAVAYLYVDGELQPPAPKQEGASGNTFVTADVDFVDDRILSGVSADLPESDIDAISVVGDGFGATYVLAATSDAGGFLDIVVGPEGDIFSVDPV
ncbi:MAG: hypothetical protein WA964_14485 [Ilumatobacter sp.]|uniref:hypothetical protein n=1 Tax=Ilumatobacter sp. TaxID=1967498 RepID=UPI003C736F47